LATALGASYAEVLRGGSAAAVTGVERGRGRGRGGEEEGEEEREGEGEGEGKKEREREREFVALTPPLVALS
jgi:hypothetical protein